jgi:hypothetical protein
MNIKFSLVIATLALLGFCGTSSASVESELKHMTGYTIIYAGVVQEKIERNYSEKLLKLDNGWVFKLDCLMLMPLNFTDVIVFGKRYPEALTKQYPNLPEQMLYQFKLLINQDVCDASLVK